MEKSSIDTKLDSILEQISELEQLNLKSARIEKIKSHLDKLIKGYPIIKTKFRQQSIFRARKTSPNGNADFLKEILSNPFLNVSELWYPPIEAIQIYGRVNNIGKQIFYGSINEAGAIAELTPKIGDVLTILECELIGRQVPVVFAWGLAEYALANKPGEPMESVLNRYLGDAKTLRKFRVIDKFLEHEFTKIVISRNEDEYKITIAMFELLMEKNFIEVDHKIGQADGIAYQSVVWQNGLNLAFKPQSVDRLYKPVGCRMLVVADKKDAPMTYEWRLVNEAKSISAANEILWRWDDNQKIRRY